ncbi:hypothetical protein QR680_009555 [Steinernema hermaphroditum]|uniref:C3H1-type domain-containing protein n=1 Tax=Steinernema hermaphroditum TaxID=289476 RepID=A0AA39IMJ1_9BILA|nr:hypothetical protein QR680_009555 [Steinernema hermaphroditum]
MEDPGAASVCLSIAVSVQRWMQSVVPARSLAPGVAVGFTLLVEGRLLRQIPIRRNLNDVSAILSLPLSYPTFRHSWCSDIQQVMAEPMSDDDGEVIDRISSSSPEDISEEIEPFPQRNKRPPMTPPTPENCENIEDDISDVEPSPPQPADISSDSNNADDNDNLDYSDGEGDASEQLLNREGSSVPVEETEDKKELSDGELEEGELESDSEDEVEGATLKDNKEKSDSRSPSRSPPPKSRNDGICKFYLRGNCTWGVTCKFYHPTDAECEQLRREEGIDGRRSITRVYQRAASPAKEEDAWERGLKQARERMKKASELKKDPDFDKKRLLMSASDASPRRRSDSEDSLDRNSPGGAREKSRRIPDPVPFFPVGSSGRPPSLIDVMRNEDRRRNEAVKDLGPQVLYPSRDRDRNRNRRSHDNKTAPVPLREVAAQLAAAPPHLRGRPRALRFLARDHLLARVKSLSAEIEEIGNTKLMPRGRQSKAAIQPLCVQIGIGRRNASPHLPLISPRSAFLNAVVRSVPNPEVDPLSTETGDKVRAERSHKNREKSVHQKGMTEPQLLIARTQILCLVCKESHFRPKVIQLVRMMNRILNVMSRDLRARLYLGQRLRHLQKLFQSSMTKNVVVKNYWINSDLLKRPSLENATS